MSWLSKALGISSGQNPANAAMPYLNQIPGVGHTAYDPYIQQGQQAGSRLGGEYERQLDPTTFMNDIMGHYKQSEGYQGRRDDLMKGMGSAAAQGGYAGTPLAQEQYGRSANKLMADDEQQYLQNALGIYDKGISGEQDFYNKGFGASGSLADFLGSSLTQQGSAAFQGQSQQNQNSSDIMSALAKALGGIGGFATQGSGSLFGKKLWG
jgi:hypothetical protein